MSRSLAPRTAVVDSVAQRKVVFLEAALICLGVVAYLACFSLPYGVLWLLVKAAVALAILVHTLCGKQLLKPKTGLHEAALTAGLVATMDTAKAEDVLGYTPRVTRNEAIASCIEWYEGGAGKGGVPMIVPIIGNVRLPGWAGRRYLASHPPVQ